LGEAAFVSLGGRVVAMVGPPAEGFAKRRCWLRAAVSVWKMGTMLCYAIETTDCPSKRNVVAWKREQLGDEFVTFRI
jgi:hypothetical protein